MKSVKKILAVVSAIAMVSAPVVASASPASKLSIAQVSKARAGTNVKKSSELGGSIALLVLGAAAAIGGIIAIASDGGSKSP